MTTWKGRLLSFPVHFRSKKGDSCLPDITFRLSPYHMYGRKKPQRLECLVNFGKSKISLKVYKRDCKWIFMSLRLNFKTSPSIGHYFQKNFWIFKIKNLYFINLDSKCLIFSDFKNAFIVICRKKNLVPVFNIFIWLFWYNLIMSYTKFGLF